MKIDKTSAAGLKMRFGKIDAWGALSGAVKAAASAVGFTSAENETAAADAKAKADEAARYRAPKQGWPKYLPRWTRTYAQWDRSRPPTNGKRECLRRARQDLNAILVDDDLDRIAGATLRRENCGTVLLAAERG